MRRPSESTTAVWSNRAAGAGPAGASGVHVSVAGRYSQRSASAVPADSPPNTISRSFTSSRITEAPVRGLGVTLNGVQLVSVAALARAPRLAGARRPAGHTP